MICINVMNTAVNRLLYHRRWRERNLEKVRTDSREWYKANRQRASTVARAWKKANPDKTIKSYRECKYGKGAQAHLDIQIERQNNCCAICKVPLAMPHLDHNHHTKQLRGALCRTCNLMIGFSKEQSSRLLAAIEYLRQWDADAV